MVFLNPLVLLGLVAAAIPLILHLLNLRKLRTIHFSTLTFLKELQQTRIRRLKLRQFLLLLIRTLLIILIVLAFARPALHGTLLGGLGSHANSTIVFILDDSFSMLGTDEHGEYFKQAREACGKLLDLLKDGDDAFLIRLSDLPRASINPATHDFAALRKVINETQPSTVRRPMEEALRVAAGLLRSSKNANQEVYIISDMQRSLFLESGRTKGAAADSSLDSRLKFFIINVGSKAIVNLGIDSVEVRTQIFEQNKPVKVFVSARNFSNSPVRDYIASLYLDGTRAAQNNISAGAWEPAGTDFSVTPKHAGFTKGYAELESDALEPDNRRYFTLSIPERIPVAMVSGSPEDIRFVSLASQAGTMGEKDRPLFDVEQVGMQKFPFLNLKNVDVLLVSNIRTFSSADADRIASFVKRGGGLIVFPGSEIDRENYNSTLLPPLDIPPIEGLTTAEAQTPLSFQNVDLDHPLFATMFEKQDQRGRRSAGSIESPRILKTIRHLSGKQGRTLISLTDGGAFLSEYKIGAGRALMFSVAPVLSWSDFPLKGLFAPLIYRCMIYLSSQGETIPSFRVGEEPVVSVKRTEHAIGAGGANGEQYSLISPDGTEELVQPSGQARGISASTVSFRLRRLTVPGFYELRSAGTPLTIFGVNIDPRESDTRKITGEDLAAFWKRAGIPPSSVRSITQTDQLQSAVLELRYGVELWKHCVALALLMALLEMAVARDAKAGSAQQPAGSPV